MKTEPRTLNSELRTLNGEAHASAQPSGVQSSEFKVQSSKFRLLLITCGLALTHLASAADTLVTNTAGLTAAALAAQPGDTIVMQDGVWADADILFTTYGTEAQPVTLRAQTLGRVHLTGQSRLRIAGRHLVVDGLIFTNGYRTSGDVIAFRESSAFVANSSKLINCAILDYNPPNPTNDTKWVSIYGVSNRVENCHFRGKANVGTTLIVWVSELPDPNNPNYHVITRNYFGPRPLLTAASNGGETIRVGTSDYSMNISRTTVEDNFFDRCNGDVEIISSKSCENIYRRNTFWECEGALTLRHGNSCTVEGNYFFGNLKPQTGGVRIIGENHRVLNNYFQDLAGTSSRAPLVFMQGFLNTPLNGYFQVSNATVAFNTFVNCNNTFVVGLSGTVGGLPTTLPPKDSTVANNIVLQTSGRIVDLRLGPENFTWTSNLFASTTLGITNDGVLAANALLVTNGVDGIYRPSAASPALGSAAGGFDYVTSDFEGHPRPLSGKDIGADQASVEPRTSVPQSSLTTGPLWMRVSGSVVSWPPPAPIFYGTALGGLQLNASANAAGTLAYDPPAGTLLAAGTNQTLRVVFTPVDTVNFSSLTQTVTLNVLQAPALVTWAQPADLVYGVALSSTQLNAAANVAGTLAYNPSSGTVLNAGAGQTLQVVFMPNDTANFASVTQQVSLHVSKATPNVVWPGPASVEQGSILGGVQLNATVDVPGSFVYSPASGTVLAAGSGQILSTVFTPADAANYFTVTQTVEINVTIGGRTLPNITWAQPAPVLFGTPLGLLQLNASANVSGTFTYSPPPGTVLPVGNGHVLNVTFTPNDEDNFIAVQKSVALSVAPLTSNALLRVAYLVPSNRAPQSHAPATLQGLVRQYQEFFAAQMANNGFGRRSFTLETEPDGVTPLTHVLTVPQTDGFLRGDIYGQRVLDAARAAGLPVGAPGQLWWLIPEVHVQNPDGTMSGSFELGVHTNTLPISSGWAISSSEKLALYQTKYQTNALLYDGRIVPELGPYPLVQDVSFPWFEGITLSGISSSVIGSGARSIGSAFGLPHDFRNDENFNGNLMGFGFRGIRGVFHPELYLYNYCTLSYASALTLSVHPFFNPGRLATDIVSPNVTVPTAGPRAPFGGLLEIEFSATDDQALHLAVLTWEQSADFVMAEEVLLTGTAAGGTFATAFYSPGQTNRYRVTVYDHFGNERSATTTIVPSVPVNQAPQPFIRVSPVLAGPGEDVLLDASQTFDPEQSAGFLEVEWDLNGDGNFDTLPTSELAGLFNFSTQGSLLIRARITDPAGDVAISAPVALNIVDCQTELSPTSRSHGYGAGTNKVTVAAGPKCRWLPTTTNDWITLLHGNFPIGRVTSVPVSCYEAVGPSPVGPRVDGPEFTGTVVLNYGVAANPLFTERRGYIFIGDQIYTVIQQPTVCTFSISPTNRFHGYGSGGTGTIKVTTRAGCDWAAVNTNSWITITSGGSGTGTGTVNYVLGENRVTGRRSGNIVIDDRVFTVSQWGTNCELALTPATRLHSASPETSTNTISTASTCGWVVENTNAWISILSPLSGTISSNLIYSITPNFGAETRSGVVTVNGETLTVTQSACSLAIEPAARAHLFSAATGSICVAAGPICEWSVSTTNSWISILSASSAVSTGRVDYAVEANPISVARVGVISVAGYEFLITQDPKPCYFAVTNLDESRNESFGESGGDSSIFIHAELGCTWSAVSDSPWISILDGASGNGPGTVIFVVARNDGPARSGIITVADEDYHISQASGVREVRLTDTAVASGQTNAIYVILDAHGGENALAFSLCYDSNLLAFASASLLPSAPLTAVLTVANQEAAQGRVGLTVAMPPGFSLPPGTGTVVKVLLAGKPVDGKPYTTVSVCDAPVARALVDAGFPPTPLTASFGSSSVRVLGSCSLNEALDVTNLTFVTGAIPWGCAAETTHDLEDAAVSGAVPVSGESYFETTVTGPGTLSFWWKVSSEQDNDRLRFYMDGGTQFTISGEVDWEQRIFSVPAGAHALRWRYNKNALLTNGQDRAWVDQVVYEAAPPSITSQPVAQAVDQGATATFSAAVAGQAPFTYQWRLNNAPLVETAVIRGTITPTLTLSNVQPSQVGNYSVVITTAQGALVSSNAALTVTPILPLPESLDTTFTITSSGNANWVGQALVTHDGVDAGRSGPITHNQASSFQTVINGPGTLRFWWKVSAESGDRLRFFVNGTEQSSITGDVDWQEKIYTLGTNAQTLLWTYAKNSSGSLLEDRGWVDEIRFIPQAVAITAQPTNQITDQGTNAVFTVGVSGTPPMYYQWLFNGAPMGAPNSATLTVPNVQPANNGLYSVFVTNVAGSATSSNASLQVNLIVPLAEALDTTNLNWTTTTTPAGAAPWIGQVAISRDGTDAARTGLIGDSVTTTLATTLTGPGTFYFWWKVSSQGSGSDRLRFYVNGSEQENISGEVDWTFRSWTIPSGANQTVEFRYQKNSSGRAGLDMGWVDQVRYVPNSVPTAPFFAVQPVNRTVVVPAGVSFNALAGGSTPLSYLWHLNGVPLTNGSGVAGATTTNLSLTGAAAAVAGNYSVLVTNSAGATFSTPASLTVITAPFITNAPVDRYVVAGSNAVFNVGALGQAPLSYQWMRDGTNLINGAKFSGVTTSNLTVLSAQVADQGIYSVIVSNAAGTASSLQGAGTLTVWSAARSGVLAHSQNTLLEANVTGPGTIKFAWKVSSQTNSDAFLFLNGATELARLSGEVDWQQPLFTIPAGTHTLRWQYVKDATGSAGSDAGFLDHVEFISDTAVAPLVTAPPAAQTALAGTTISFAATVTGSMPLTYQWRLNGASLPNSASVGGAQTPRLTLSGVTLGQAGHYSLLVSNSAGVAISSNAALVVNALPAGNAPVITTPPVSRQTSENASVTFAIAATGAAPLSYQWFLNGAPLANVAGASPVSGATTTSLSLSNVPAAQAGNYTVVVSNAVGLATARAALSVLTLGEAAGAPYIAFAQAGNASWIAQTSATAYDGVDEVRTGSINHGENSRLETYVEGPGTVTFWWKVSCEASDDNLRFYIGAPEIVRISGEVPWEQKTYAVPAGTQLLKWRYGKGTSGTAGQDAGWVDGITYTPSTISIAPFVTNQPVSLNLFAGHTANFGAGVGGSMPMTFQWRSNGLPVLNGSGVSGAQGPRLTILSAPAQSASYSLFVSNAAGTTTSAVVTLNATSVLSAPVISLQPTNRSVTEGESASFSMLASGALPLSYQWLLNGVALTDGAGVSGATTNTLSLNNVQAAHIGTYSVVVSNTAGFVVSSPASLTVLTMSEVVGAPYLNLAVIGQPWLVQNGSTYVPGTTNGGARLIVSVPPSITAQPAGQSVVEGNDMMFIVGTAGSPPLFLQWRLNGVALFDGNGLSGVNSNVLIISGVQPVDAGNYSVTVSNAVGFVTSSNAALAVLTPPSITTPPAALTVPEGAPASFTVVAAGTAPLTYQWKRNGTNIFNGGSVSGATTATLTLNNAQPLQGGLYSVAISNAAGGLVSSPVSFSVIAALTIGEAMNAPYLTWNTDLGAPWTVQTNVTHDGEAAAQSGTITDGTSSTLETTVVGPGTIRFWWRVSSQTNADPLTFSVNGSTFAQISGLTGWEYQSFVVPGGLVTLRWTYSKDAGGLAGLDRGWLDEVDFVPSFGPSVPVIVQEPSGVEVNPGEDVTFSIVALGTAPLSYQWRFEGQELGDGGNILGSKTPTMIISGVNAAQAGLYDVVVRNPYSLDISEQVFLSVIPVISIPVAVDTDHTNLLWVSGATVGGAPWRGQTNVKSDLIDAAASGTIGHGMTSWVQTVVSGPGAISFFWKSSSETNQDRMRFTIDGVEAANISGETDWRQRTFTINDPGTVLRWSYTKSATGLSGLDRAWLDQVVFGPTAPIITNTSQELFVVDVGTTVRFNVAASGTTPFSYQWSFTPPGALHGTNLINGNTNFPLYPGFLVGAVGNRRLTISNAQPEQTGTYEVDVSNPAGSAVSPPFTLQVIPSAPLSEALNTNLVWETYGYSWWVGSTNIHRDGLAARSGSMPGSESTTLKTTVQGPGTLSFWWRASTETNVDILSFEINGSTTSEISGNHNWSQKTYDLDSGTYALTWSYNKSGLFTNGLDTVFVDQVVFAPIAPIITNQPVARVIDQGSAVSFTAGVRGTPPLSYQWLHNGLPLVNGAGISGARSLTLNLSGVQLLQAGSYSLEVSNVVAVTPTASALLTVLPTFPIAEAIDNADYTWTTGSPGWIGQNQTTFDGVDAVKSPTTAHSGSSTMQATLAGPGTVQFKWKVSSQTNNGTGGDELIFYTNNTALARISGEAGWEQRSFSILPGNQIVKWTYAKNASVTNGQDRGWVDNFVFIPTPPSVLTSPSGTNVDQGASATFTVGVYGTPPLSYQWRYNGGDILGANSSTLTLNNVQPGEAGNYSVVVGNAAGTANSLSAPLTVNTLIPLAEALDTTNFVWATSGSPAWVGQIAVSHDGTDSARIQGVPHSGSASVQSTITGPGTISFWWKVSSQTNGDYLTFFTNGVQAVRISGEQDWETRAINLGSGNQTLTWTYAKNSATVAGQDRAWLDQVTFGAVAPTVTGQPVSKGIDEGANTSFSVTVAGTPPFSYQWQRGGIDLVNGAGIAGATTSNLVLTAVQPGQGGAYRVLVTGQAGGAVSAAANLTVYSLIPLDDALDTPGLTWTTNGTPTWTGHAALTHDNTDAARSGAIGHSGSTSMSSVFAGPGAVSFWWKVSSQTNNDYLSLFTNGVLAVRISGEVDWQFKSINIGSGNQTLTWTYAKNGSTTNGLDRAFVDQVSFGLVAPVIVTQPASVSAEPGSNVTFTVVVAATPPIYYQWLFNGSPLANGPGLGGANAASLTVSNVGAFAVGTYSVFISNSVNSVTSSGATLTVSSNVTLNSSLDGGLSFTAGGTATAWKGQTGVTRDGVDAAQTGAATDSTYTFIKTTVTGPGPLSFWWKVSSEADHDYLRFMVDAVDQVRISGDQDWQLINFDVPSGTHELQWRYSKNATLAAGQDRGWLDYVWFNQTPPPIVIVTTAPPVIVMQPASQSVEAGDIVTLSVATTGTAPKTYRWFHNATNAITDGPTIGGANTAELTLYNIAEAQAGHYTVTITNVAGQAITTPALVTVLPVIDLAEALDSYDLFFTTVGEAGWIGHTVVTHDGTDAARTGRIFDNQSSTLETMVAGPGSVSFWWKVSSETNADHLTFFLNGVPQQSISGEVGWQQRTFPLAAGTQLLEWTYLKNGSVSTNADRGWLDQIVYDDAPPVTNTVSVSNLHLSVSDNTLSINWEGRASKTYTVYFKEALSDLQWTLLDTEVLVTWKVVGGEIVPDVITATATDGIGTSMRFYRVQEQ